MPMVFVISCIRWSLEYPMSFRQQMVMNSGQLPSVYVGRDEFGVQQFHHRVGRILEKSDEDLADLFVEQTWMNV